MSETMRVAQSVKSALDEGMPIVALESALITHGFAYPHSVRITREMADVIRAAGALPAVVGVWRGVPTVGLSDAQIDALARETKAIKVSVRDLPMAQLRGVHGGTTVAATMTLAHRAGLRVFATGGIGGVHRGHPEDVSADLPTLASVPLIVVCAGAKAILDLPRTLEFLETWGVPVLGWQTDAFPAFYSRASGLPVDLPVTHAREVVTAYRKQRRLRLPQGVLVTAPVPAAAEIPADELAALIDQAVQEADAGGISGRAVTPFLLEQLVALTDGQTRAANESLLIHNAHVAAEIAVALEK